MGQLVGWSEDFEPYEQWRDKQVKPEYRRFQQKQKGGLTDVDAPISPEESNRARVELNTAEGGDKADDWIPFNEPSENEIAKRAYENRKVPQGGGLTQTPTGPVAKGTIARDEPEQVQLPPQVAARLIEGVATKFRNGQIWTLQNGKPVRVQ